MDFSEESVRDMLSEATTRNGDQKLRILPGGAPVEKLYAFKDERWRLAVFFEKSEWWWCFESGRYIGGLNDRVSAYKWVTEL